ncbi:MAG: glycoside hydrolase family 3 N-terminal domain-containing protein [Pyrinomonadaceae bacterium]
MSDISKTLSTEEKVGQLLFIGIPGPELDDETISLINEVNPSGVVLFTRNITSYEGTRELTDRLHDLSKKTRLIIAVDQEGGLVDRFRRITTPFPSPRSIRESGSVDAAAESGQMTGELLRRLGFDLNLAPVLCIMNDARDKLSNGLYTRSFGATPGEVLRYAVPYLKALHGTGCPGCLKHFPGLGGGAADSHDEAPKIGLTREELREFDLVPYVELLNKEPQLARAILIGHGVYPNVDETLQPATMPATMSDAIVSGLLRNDLGFDRLVLTDDLEMGAIIKQYGIADAALQAILAGNDGLLICSRADFIRSAHSSLLNGVRDGRLSAQRLDESIRRIAAFKLLCQPPMELDIGRLRELAVRTEALNTRLNLDTQDWHKSHHGGGNSPRRHGGHGENLQGKD